MKNNKKWLTCILALLLMACIGSMQVWAETDDGADTIDDVAVQTPLVSGCDLSVDRLAEVKVKQYGFSMKVPEGTVLSLDSTAQAFAATDFTRSYFIDQGCILYAVTSNDNYCGITMMVNDLESINNYYGDYNSLNDEKKSELIAANGNDENTKSEFVTINGQTYLMVTRKETDATTSSTYRQYHFTTVIGSQKYTLVIQTANATEEDNKVVNEMIQSIRLKGMVNFTKTEIALMVACGILAVAVALVYFFFYRANRFVKAGIYDYKRLGFDFPDEGIDDEDVYDDDEDVDDFDDDEEVAEKSADDESIL